MNKAYYNKKRLFLFLIEGYEIDEINYPDSIFYDKEDKCIMEYNTKTEIFWLGYNLIWSVFESKYGLNHQQINKLLIPILEEHFKCKVKRTTGY